MTLRLLRRPGLTLVELMVVVALIIVLATLVVGVANTSLVDSYKIVGAADRLSGWLLNAKSRAVRDRVPVGLRLIRDAENPNFARQAQLIEMPALYSPNQITSDLQNLLQNYPGAPLLAIRYQTSPPSQGVNAGDLMQENVAGEVGVYLFWPENYSPFPLFRPQTRTTGDIDGEDLYEGDLIRINELNSTHRISEIYLVTRPSWFPAPPAGVTGRYYRLVLAISRVVLPTGQTYPSSPPYPANLLPRDVITVPPAGSPQLYPTGYPAIGGANYFQSHYFGLFRASRPILGEPLLQLPANMAIDVSQGNSNIPPAGLANDEIPLSGLMSGNGILPFPATGEIEIIFNPNGTVLNNDSGMVALWLRDTRNSGGQHPLAFAATPTAPNAANATFTDVYVDRRRLMDAGEHVIVAIYTRTGSVSTYPVFPPDLTGRYDGRPVTATGGDSGVSGPFKFALQATNTGL